MLNKYFRDNNQSQDVEWGFSFDVHLNAFFPPLILLHFCQLFFYNGKFSKMLILLNETVTKNSNQVICTTILISKINFCFSGLINHEWFISRLLGNTFWLVAVLYYMYITFLGYSSLQILQRTHLILTPLPIVLLIYIISLSGGFNITHYLMEFYKNRVL